jgi:hypothetical protein
MPNYDTYIYANGALRLTRHGKNRGGNVLVYEHDGKTDQCEIDDDKVAHVARFLGDNLPFSASAEGVSLNYWGAKFDVIRSVHAIPGSTRLAAA